MDTRSMPHLYRESDDDLEKRDSLEALQNLMELIGEDVYNPSRVRAYVRQARRLIQTMQNDPG